MLGQLPERLEAEGYRVGHDPPGGTRLREQTFPVVKLVRAFGGCLGTKRR
jgi:hypothetical protein